MNKNTHAYMRDMLLLKVVALRFWYSISCSRRLPGCIDIHSIHTNEIISLSILCNFYFTFYYSWRN